MAEDDAKSEIKAKIDTAPEDASVETSVAETGTAPDAEQPGAGDGAPDETHDIEADTTSSDTPEVRPKPKAKTKPKPRARTRKKTGTAPEVEADSVPAVKSEARTDTPSAPPPEVAPDAAPEVEADSVPEVKPEARVDTPPAPPPEVAPDAAPEAAPDAAPGAAADEVPEVKPKARTDTPLAAALAVAPDVKPKPKPRPGPKSNRKVALVTGASGGIGEAFARKLAADGYALVLVARSDGELNRVAGLVTAKHDLPVATVPIDLTSPGAADEVQMEFERRNITPEIVVNNAGFGLNGPVADLDHNRQIEMIDLNIRTLTDLSLRFLPEMRVRGRGGIINIASTAAYMPGPFMAVYYASKAYVLSFSEALATELKGTGITVTTVCPGPTATGFQSEAGMEKAALVKLFPMMSAEEVADIGYEGFRSGKRVVIPGVMNRIIAAATPMIPNAIILPLVRMLQGPRS